MQAPQQRAVGLQNGPEAPPPPPPPLPPPSIGFQLPAKAALPRDEPGPAPPLPPPLDAPPPAAPQPPWGAPASQVWALPGAEAPAAPERTAVEPATMWQRAHGTMGLSSCCISMPAGFGAERMSSYTIINGCLCMSSDREHWGGSIGRCASPTSTSKGANG